MPNHVRFRRGSPQLWVRSTDAVEDGEKTGGPWRPLPWFVGAIGAGLVAAAVGWLLVTALVLLGWLTARAGDLGDAFNGATQLWLLAHGGGLQIAGVRWTLVPLSITLVLAVLLGVLGAAAAQSMADGGGGGGVPLKGIDTGRIDPGWIDPGWIDPGRIVRRVTLVTGITYALAVSTVATFAGSVNQGVRGAVGSVVLAALAAGWGAARGTGYRPADALPGWARPLPAAAAAATWTVLCGGAVALSVGLIQHRERIGAIAAGLGADPGSTVQLTVAQLLFLPNLVIWAASWTVGAGFTFGQGSIVSPPSTDLGLLPSIPVLGALPAEGAGNWVLLWLLTGLAAGVVAVAVVLRRRPHARFEEVALVSGLAGVLAAVVLTALAVASSGDLGGERLTGLGPRLVELGVLAGALMGMSGLLVGMVTGLVRQLRGAQDGAAAFEADPPQEVLEAPTVRIGRSMDDNRAPAKAGDRVES